MQNLTTIAVTPETKALLKEMKHSERQSFESIILELYNMRGKK